MNENAVKWIKWLPLRDALGGAAFGVVSTLVMLVRMLWYQGDEPVIGMTLFLGVVWTLTMAIIGVAVGLAERGYLSRLQNASDAEAAVFVRTLPGKYALIGLSVGLLWTVGAAVELRGTSDSGLALWSVGIATALFAVVGFLLGLRSRSALQKRLRPSAASAAQLADTTAPSPGSAAAGRTFANVWITTRSKIESATKLRMYDDHGTLECAGDALRFQGRKQALTIRNITDVRLVRQRVNWVAIGVVLAIVAAFAVLANYLSPGRSLVSDLTILAAAAVIGIYANAKLRWVRVSFRGEGDAAREAFFTDGTNYGWGAITGGAQRLFEALRTKSAAACGAASAH